MMMNVRRQGNIRIFHHLSLYVLLFSALALSCGDEGPLGIPPVTQVEIVAIDPPADLAELDMWTIQSGPSLHFIVSNEYRTPNGFFFEGRNPGTIYEELTGRVEIIKDSDGWMRVGAVFSYESEFGDFVESILGPFAGIALDVYEPISAEPFIDYPTDQMIHWTSDTVFVSDGNVEFERYFTYGIEYIGEADLVADGQVAKGFTDVIRYTGEPNSTTPGQRPDFVEAYLAPDYGIIYSLFRFFDVENACALIGYGGSNILFPDGESVVDYFPASPGNHWLYEFSNDSDEGETVDFRFRVEGR